METGVATSNKFSDKYTTNEKKIVDQAKPEKDQTEKGKVELSNDAFAMGEILESLNNSINRSMRLFAK
jgi:hypothetical protein